MKMILRTVFVLAVLMGLAGSAFVYFGVFNVAATREHNAWTYHLLHYAMLRSVKARARQVQVPDLSDAGRIRNGAVLYRQHCLQCHGAPGVEPHELAFGARPAPANLVEAGREWSAAEIYWVAKHGIKMTAMPGWKYRLSEQELWDLTAFVKQLPRISPVEYQREYASPSSVQTVADSPDVGDGRGLGDPKAGRHAIEQYLCATCHQIPGVVGAEHWVGPPLRGIATRTYIGGVLVNTPENMMAWLRDPQRIKPMSAMPNLHIREQDVRDIAAYLYTLK